MKKRDYIIVAIIILLDQMTKLLMRNRSFAIIPNILELNYTENTGGAFGIGSKYVILISSIILLCFILYFMYKYKNRIDNPLPICLIFAGGIGNCIDRIFRGYVIDFIDINIMNFPNFNISDICITIGIVLLIFNQMKKYKNSV